MGSTNTTANLSLSSWTETDKPQRIDFVNDNNIIDSVLGGHINDTITHVTADDKQKIKNQIVVVPYHGSGHTTQEIPLTFAPKAVISYYIGQPLCKTDSNGVNLIYAGIATAGGSSSGISLNDNIVTVNQTDQLSKLNSGDCSYQLNARGGHYVLILVQSISFDNESNT